MKHIIGTAFLILALAIIALPMNVWATIYSGTLGSPNPGGLKFWGNNLPSTASLSYIASNEDAAFPGYWVFYYEWNEDSQGGISHISIETTEGLTLGDFYDYDDSTGIGDTEIGYLEETPPGGEIYSLYGIKFQDGDSLFWVQMVTKRQPMWGDVYVKDGVHWEAANTGFGPGVSDTDPDFATGTPNDWNNDYENAHILVPDTDTDVIPEPGTLLTLVSGLVGLAGYGKFRFRRKRK